MKKFARIIGTGSYLPPKVVTNHDLEKTLDTNHDWIVARTGISERRIVEEEGTCDLAVKASNKALEMAGVDASELDLIILATTTPDKIFPATATMLQNQIGATCPAFDIQAVCAGFVFAMTTAQQYIENGNAKKVLVVGSDTLSKIVDWSDRGSAILFGEPGVIQMTGNDVFKIAVSKLSELAEKTLQECNLTNDDIDWLVPHQANIRIISAIAKRIKLPIEKVIITLSKHGNTSAASIPLALDTAVRDGRIKKGHKLMLEGIGGGFSWGGLLVEY